MNPSPPYGIETQLFSHDLASDVHICLEFIFLYCDNLQNQTETLCVCTTYGEMAYTQDKIANSIYRIGFKVCSKPTSKNSKQRGCSCYLIETTCCLFDDKNPGKNKRLIDSF